MGAFDILIAGAGPAGAAAARMLAIFAPDLRVVMVAPVEKRPCRGEVLSPLAPPVLRHLGLWSAFLAQGFAPSHHTFTAWGEGGLRSSEMLLEAHGPAWRVDRARFDDWFASAASGAATRIDAKVSDLERDADGWSVDCGDGGRHAARLVIDATGRANALVLRQGRRSRSQDRLVAAYAEGTTSEQTAPELLVEAFDDGWWYTMSLGEGRHAFVCMTDADIARDLRLSKPHGWHAALAKTRFISAIARKISRLDAPRLLAAGGRCAAMPVGFRFLCVGDAASAFDPISGHGVVKAMRSGVFAAYAAGDCLVRNDGAALDRYGAWVAREAAAYEAALREHYASESRWADRPFWRRRCADVSSSSPPHQ
ncbi:NAD(P)/FAD-dependent oxidoreductase [Bradyrhizobium brasilense]|uniref:NAD(P)/FAD-dependent oxidoreductase n=1 Tax=Bradyrhizobium brasilense TaxID=1419277 RepID=UPI002877D155|nr:tryptophan 7-halogenase [Bradyrhizobium brasilense]